MKNKKDFLKRHNHPRQRREYIDYDYSDKLSDTDHEWLSKFTKEYYGADFEINNTFVLASDFKPLIKKLIKNNDNEVKEKYQKYFNLIKYIKDDTYIQISGNSNNGLNFDLRKVRLIDKYYEDEDGNMTTNRDLKYKNTIHDIENHLINCNANVNSSSRDVICNGIRYDSDVFIDNQMDASTPENDNSILFTEILQEVKKLKEKC